MKAVFTIAGLQADRGGPARTVPALCRALAQQGAGVELITISEGAGSNMEGDFGELFKFTRLATRTNRYSPWSWHRQFTEILTESASVREVVLYDVGLWLPQNHLVSKFARKQRIPLIISPRGMLSKRALEVAKWKKRLAWALYQRADLAAAAVIHATSEAEAEDCRRRGLTQPIAIVPNGIDLPDVSNGRQNRSERTVLFLSRLHPIKGLGDLVEAWSQVRPRGWRVVVAGPDEGEYGREIRSAVSTLGLEKEFEFVGPVGDEEKWSLFRDANLFVLPSYSESFGQAIGEALAAGVPVITTRATPWGVIESNHCGWWTETGTDPLKKALLEATLLSDQELAAMGERGREMVRSNFSWEESARRFLSIMRWLLRDSERPSWLV